ncbi:RNA recognition motif domain-containing protein, partial [Mycobacterium kansasii]
LFFSNSARPKGYAFVRFRYEADARAAMGILHGQRTRRRLRQSFRSCNWVWWVLLTIRILPSCS